jgi:DNA mismatch repair protein MutS2
MEAAAGLDLVVAKRRFAARLDCRRPGISEDGVIEVVRGRHPLLLQRKVKVVPLDFRFPDRAQVVLISGPNAGGKTVVLKTLGLFSLMLGAGMYLPAEEGTRLPVFSRVFADIGDEQNLDSDLSSFTAHVGRLKEILEKSDKGTLVLVDEIGSSTAPEEGAALAVAVLEQLRDAGVRSVITTHFGALKMYAQDEPGMANAAMEWGRVESGDGAAKAGPTYRLKMGFPGESSAFEIAAGAGMPAKVIERARTRIGTEWLDMGAKLKSLDEELHRVRVARAEAETEQQKATRLRQELDARLRESREEARAAREKLRADEERFLRDKRREIENLVRRIKETGASHESVVAAKQEVGRRLDQLGSAEAPSEAVPTAAGPEELKSGDVVESHTFRRQGVIVETDGNRATVAFGHIKMELAVADLRLVAPGDVKPLTEPVVEESFNFDRRLSVRGMTREEADLAVDKFLDEAEMTGALELTIVHGKGGGVLRRALWDRLKHDARVEEMKLAEAAGGGSGVTVVKLKSEG